MENKKQLDLHIEIDVLTAGSAAEIVNAILETLLYQRNQIPFVYKTFRYYVNKWQEQDHEEESQSKVCGMQSFQVERKKQQAIATKQAISSMRQIINNIFETKPIKSLRFLFGSTIFTAREAYTVHIPTENIAINHFHENHKISLTTLNQTLLSLLTNESLYNVFSHHLTSTNIYLELELLENENLEIISCTDHLQNSEIFPKDCFSLPAVCKDIHIYLLHKQTEKPQLICCKDLKVFDDLRILNLNCSNDRKKDSIKEIDYRSLTNFKSSWWEAEIVVRGFKDQPIKGFNIWS